MNIYNFFFMMIISAIEFFVPDRLMVAGWKNINVYIFFKHRYLINCLIGFIWIFFLRYNLNIIHQFYNKTYFAFFEIKQMRQLNLISLIIFIMTLDYVTYWWHRANHHFKILRIFHQVHHSDLEVDASTTFRFHFVELFIHFFLMLAVVFVLKIHLFYLLLFETLLLLLGYFHHSNIFLPEKFNTIISWFIVTPRYHLNHHFVDLNHTNSNYCAILTFWDHLHGTYTAPIINTSYTLGIKNKRTSAELSLCKLLTMPFKL